MLSFETSPSREFIAKTLSLNYIYNLSKKPATFTRTPVNSNKAKEKEIKTFEEKNKEIKTKAMNDYGKKLILFENWYYQFVRIESK